MSEYRVNLIEKKTIRRLTLPYLWVKHKLSMKKVSIDPESHRYGRHHVIAVFSVAVAKCQSILTTQSSGLLSCNCLSEATPKNMGKHITRIDKKWSHNDNKTTHSEACVYVIALRWRHIEYDGVSNHQPNDCLLNRLFRPRWKKASKLRATDLCAGNSPVTGEFPAQRASNAENVLLFDDVIMG